ncbi:MAG TPA: hypothetical protein VGO58_08535 [Chitinophagaceae bacterium]|jgi:hypothetical protein|nr:hypothetical protein [Chitinophagaceae bacterium]
MRKSSSKNPPALPGSVKQDLARLLLLSDPDSVIGIGIRIYLEKDPDMDELIYELQRLANVDPVFMTGVIGTEAMALLFPLSSTS